MTKDPDIRRRFIDMRAEGRSLLKCSEELGIAYNTALNWNKDDAELISRARSLLAEELYEKYFMAKQRRVALFGERLLAIKEELDKRDLSEIPTPKLFDMMIKCEERLKREEKDISYMTDDEITISQGKRDWLEKHPP